MSKSTGGHLAAAGTLAVALAFLSACSESKAPITGVQAGPHFNVVSPSPELGLVKLCKVNGTGEFVVSINGVQSTVTVSDGECVVVHEWTSLETINFVTIFETTEPESVTCDPVGSDLACYFVDDNFVQVRVSGAKGATVTFTNPPGGGDPLLGRMTGGGHQIRVDGVRITRGFTIHCDVTLTNNLEVNWPGGNKWHITKEMIDPTCIDDPNVEPDPPPAPFDTFIAQAEGQLNNEDGVSIMRFKFVDAGEPGSNDRAWIAIWATGADPDVTSPILEVGTEANPALLDGGNIQAHFDQPHK